MPYHIMDIQLRNALLSIYKNAVKQIKFSQSREERNAILYELYVEHGICWCSRNRLNIGVCYDTWVESKCNYFGFWGPIPKHAFTYFGVIYCLKLRIRILKKFKGY